MKWLLVGIIALCNTLGDVLNTAGMKRQGEIEDLRPRSVAAMVKRILRNPLVLAGFGALAVSFFALLSLLSITTVSFAVPATAISYLLERDFCGMRRRAAVLLADYAAQCFVAPNKLPRARTSAALVSPMTM